MNQFTGNNWKIVAKRLESASSEPVITKLNETLVVNNGRLGVTEACVLSNARHSPLAIAVWQTCMQFYA